MKRLVTSIVLVALALLVSFAVASAAPSYYWTGAFKHHLPTPVVQYGYPYAAQWDTLIASGDSVSMTPVRVDGTIFTTSEVTITCTTDTALVKFWSATGMDGDYDDYWWMLKGEAVTFPFYAVDSVRVVNPDWNHNDGIPHFPNPQDSNTDDGSVLFRCTMTGYRLGTEDSSMPLKRGLQ